MIVAGRFDIIRTSRLEMRRWRDSDREPYAALNADPEVTRYFPRQFDRAASDAHIDRMEIMFDRQGYGLWALEVIEGGEFIGFTGLTPMPPGVPGASNLEVGWRLAKTAWHQGYATEAAFAAVAVAFDGLRLPEIWSTTAILNEPSQAVMRRIGMTRHSEFEHPAIQPDHPLCPHVAYRLVRPPLRPGRARRIRKLLAR